METPKTYSESALRTDLDGFGYDKVKARVADRRMLKFLHGIFGLVTEVGKLADAAKKHLFYGKELDIVNVNEELGDIFWYLNIVLSTLATERGITVEELETEIKTINIAKLQARYPDKFTEEQALNRDLRHELEVLQGGLV